MNETGHLICLLIGCKSRAYVCLPNKLITVTMGLLYKMPVIFESTVNQVSFVWDDITLF
jgi:hypothetical protein